MLPQGTKFSVCLLAAKTVHPRPMCGSETEGGEGDVGGTVGGNAEIAEAPEESRIGMGVSGAVLMPFSVETMRTPSLLVTPSQTYQSNLTAPSQTVQSNTTVHAPLTSPPPLLIVPPPSPPPTITTPATSAQPSASVPVYIASPTLNELPLLSTPTSTPAVSASAPSPAPAPAPQQSVAQYFMWSYYYLNWQWLRERFSERFSFFRTARSSSNPNTNVNTSSFTNRSMVDNAAFISTLSPEQQAFIANKKAEIFAVVNRTWQWEIDLSGGFNDDTVGEQSTASSSSSSFSSSSSSFMDQPSGAPFGMGPRACPAGSLSLVRDNTPP